MSITPPFTKNSSKGKLHVKKISIALEHCVPSDFYKCYHNYQPPEKLYDNSYTVKIQKWHGHFFKLVLNYILYIVYKAIGFLSDFKKNMKKIKINFE